jgi:hypothetical protein
VSPRLTFSLSPTGNLGCPGRQQGCGASTFTAPRTPGRGSPVGEAGLPGRDSQALHEHAECGLRPVRRYARGSVCARLPTASPRSTSSSSTAPAAARGQPTALASSPAEATSLFPKGAWRKSSRSPTRGCTVDRQPGSQQRRPPAAQAPTGPGQALAGQLVLPAPHPLRMLTPLGEMVDWERPAALDRDLQPLPHDPIRRCRLPAIAGRAASCHVIA